MSVKIMTRVWEYSGQGASELLLLLAIADNADDDGYCWPGGEYLANKVRMSYRSVMRLIQSLEETKELYCDHNRRNGNRYLVIVGMNDEQIKKGLLKFKYGKDEYKAVCDKLLYVTGDTSDVTQLCHNRCDTATSDEPSLSVNETSSQPSSLSESPPSELDAFFGAPEPSGVDLPEKINLHDQAEREQYALRLQEQRKARAEGEPWLTQYEWIKPRSGIERNTLRKVAHTLIEAGIPEPESDAVKNKWKPALEAVYIESGGDFGLIKRAGEAMVAGGLQFWPTHKWVDQVIALKAEKTQGKTSTFKPRSVHDDDESWESPAQDLTIPY